MTKKIKRDFSKRKPPTYKKRADGSNDIGAKKIIIDVNKVRLFSRFNPSDAELAAALEISAKTFQINKKKNPLIRDAMEQGREFGRFSLRGKQFDTAMKGNVVMLIWLGKQLLDQKDKALLGNDPDAPLNQNIPLTKENIKMIASEIRNEF